jgi:hypothetical protein
MYKRPSPFKHGSYKFNPPSQYDIQRLLADRAPYSPPPKKVFKPSKEIMYPETYKWLMARSELTTEKRQELMSQYNATGDSQAYLSAMHLAQRKEDIKPEVIVKKSEPLVWLGYAKLVLTIEGDRVKAHVDGKMADISKNYFNKGKRPPLRTYVEALQSFGTPEKLIHTVIDNHIWRKKHKEEIQAEFDRIFPPDRKKGVVAVKKVLKAVIKH